MAADYVLSLTDKTTAHRNVIKLRGFFCSGAASAIYSFFSEEGEERFTHCWRAVHQHRTQDHQTNRKKKKTASQKRCCCSCCCYAAAAREAADKFAFTTAFTANSRCRCGRLCATSQYSSAPRWVAGKT
jgi:hypothetical protein